jgi:hypothetical protein
VTITVASSLPVAGRPEVAADAVRAPDPDRFQRTLDRALRQDAGVRRDAADDRDDRLDPSTKRSTAARQSRPAARTERRSPATTDEAIEVDDAREATGPSAADAPSTGTDRAVDDGALEDDHEDGLPTTDRTAQPAPPIVLDPRAACLSALVVTPNPPSDAPAIDPLAPPMTADVTTAVVCATTGPAPTADAATVPAPDAPVTGEPATPTDGATAAGTASATGATAIAGAAPTATAGSADVATAVEAGTTAIPALAATAAAAATSSEATPTETAADPAVDGALTNPDDGETDGAAAAAPGAPPATGRTRRPATLATPATQTAPGAPAATTATTVASPAAAELLARATPTGGPSTEAATEVRRADPAAPVPGIGAHQLDPTRPQTAEAVSGTATAAPAAHSAAAERLIEVVERLAAAAPPRHLTIELPEMDGLRVQVAVRGSEVHLRVVGGQTSGEAFGSLEHDLGRALRQRGFDLAGSGGQPSGRRDRSSADGSATRVATAPVSRPRPAVRADGSGFLRI